MSYTLELLTTVQHGTPDGYRAGCHGSAASCGAPVSCADVYTRYQGDWSFRRRVDAGEVPADIVAQEVADLEAQRQRDKAANRKAKADAAREHEAREQRKTAPVVAPSMVEQIGDDVRRMHADGMTVAAIAVALKVSPMTVSRVRAALGLKGAQPRPGTVNHDDVRRLHAEGLSDAEIARRLGVTNSTISTIRRVKLGLPRVSQKVAVVRPDSPRSIRARKIAELHGQGLTDNQVAAALGITRTAAYQARERLRLPLNRESNSGPRRKPRPDETPTPEPETPAEYEIVHGTADGYAAGCRGRGCSVTPSCTDAMLAAHRAARHQAGGTP